MNKPETKVIFSQDNLKLISLLDVLRIPAVVIEPLYDSGGEIHDFRSIYVNDPAVKSLNGSRNEIEEQSFSIFFPGYNTDKLSDQLKQVFSEATSKEITAEKNDPLLPGSSLQINAVRIGEQIILNWKEDGKLEDQTETIRLLKNSNQDLEQFAYIASHDLQEPIRMVMSFTQLIEKRYSYLFDEEGKEFIYYAVDGARRMKALIDKLLEFSRVRTVQRKWKEIDINQLIENIIDDFGMTLHDKNTRIKYNNLPVIVSDESLVSRIFSNLISNALKYSRDNIPEINISAEENAKEWIFSIADNGIGIKKEYFEKIFLMFQRLHGKTEYPGMGMGLAICKRIVDTLGGRIWLESQPDLGTSFYFTIPKKGV